PSHLVEEPAPDKRAQDADHDVGEQTVAADDERGEQARYQANHEPGDEIIPRHVAALQVPCGCASWYVSVDRMVSLARGGLPSQMACLGRPSPQSRSPPCAGRVAEEGGQRMRGVECTVHAPTEIPARRSRRKEPAHSPRWPSPSCSRLLRSPACRSTAILIPPTARPWSPRPRRPRRTTTHAASAGPTRSSSRQAPSW